MACDKIRAKPGRPPCDVSEQVFAYVSNKLAKEKSLSAVARNGLTVCDGTRKVVRKMRGNHLEAIFREAERARVVPWERPTEGFTHAHPTFMGRPLPTPIGAAVPSERKPGRPKKIRSR